MNKIYQLLLPLLLFTFSIGIISCNGNGDKGNPSENLKELCIRQCVLETGGASLCDTKCSCASERLSKELTKEQFEALLGSLSNKSEELETNEAEIMYKNAISSCNSEVK